MRPAALRAARILHAHGFVHGDLRARNMLSAGGNPDSVMVVDFDWAGHAGAVRYPADMNMESGIAWHEDARPGRPILAEHDLHLVARDLA